MRNDNGKFELTPAMLGTIIATCLAVGSGGAFYATKGTTASAVQQAQVTQGNLLDVRVAILEERARLSAESLGEIKQVLREIQAGVADTNKKLERHVERDPRAGAVARTPTTP